MAVPLVKTETIKGKPYSETLSKEESWRLIYDDAGEVTHLFRSTGRTVTPGRMKCFETNEEAGIEIESKKLKCYKAAVKDKVVESLTPNKTSLELQLLAGEAAFYSADLFEFGLHAKEQKWDVGKVKDVLSSIERMAIK